MEKIVSLAKRRGFIFPGSEIYGGLAGTWDYGPLGVELKNNIRTAWWKRFVHDRMDMYGIDAPILLSSRVWEASGHVEKFVESMSDCRNCKSRFREDHLLEGKYGEVKIVDGKRLCPKCGEPELTQARPFNEMFKTWIGPVEDTASVVYLRPENAQGIFLNFKHVLDTVHPKLPFGIAQSGRVFRNEITPGDFLFRIREFDLMEFEYFIRPDDWKSQFEYWLTEIGSWLDFLGLERAKVKHNELAEGERAHYSKRTVDIEYAFPFGTKELCAVAYRADYDLRRHQEVSGIDLTYFDEETKERFIPHVIEPTFGIDRAVLAILGEGYQEAEDRVILRIPASLAPFKVAVFPLLANKEPLIKKARQIYEALKPRAATTWDDRGNIGKRYYSQDEIGTPWCVTVDFQTLEDDTVTVRDRDTMKQERVAAGELAGYFMRKLNEDSGIGTKIVR